MTLGRPAVWAVAARATARVGEALQVWVMVALPTVRATPARLDVWAQVVRLTVRLMADLLPVSVTAVRPAVRAAVDRVTVRVIALPVPGWETAAP
ncbi:hypothetical protein [Herbidospora cretacea]|uniref:hypothetical protein n=1 Tax=Herbidospora cretacea TaxID=28444 RepID=UPI0012F7DFB9|nr:hypothetical protein [Herbidospora cretacea]